MVGVPSLKTFLQGNQLIASTNELISALHVARSEAVKLNKKVTICSSSNGTSCTAGLKKWTKGWIVFIDADDNRTGTGVVCTDATNVDTDCLLRVHDEITDPLLSITGKFDSTNQDIEWFTFTSRGLPKVVGASASGIYSVCSFDSSDNVLASRAVVLSLSGRVRVSDNAAAITCPAAP